MDGPLRELERQALTGDVDAMRQFVAMLRRSVDPLTNDDLEKLQKLLSDELKKLKFFLYIGKSGQQTLLIEPNKRLVDYVTDQIATKPNEIYPVWAITYHEWTRYIDRVRAGESPTCYIYKYPVSPKDDLKLIPVDPNSMPEPQAQYIVRTTPLKDRDTGKPFRRPGAYSHKIS